MTFRVLIAPQEFKGSLTAEGAAEAIARGIREAAPEWELDLLPLADGGPGFIDAMRRAVECEEVHVAARDPLGRGVRATYLITRDEPRTAIIEAAQANGLLRLRPDERDAIAADTRGVGDLLVNAVGHRPGRVIVGVGGSATSDGGSGMASVLGARLLNAAGEQVRPGAAGLLDLDSAVWQRPAVWDGVEVLVAADVTNPLVGVNGAAAVYGPQKGAAPDQVVLIDRALRRFAEVIKRDLGVAIAGLPGAGAAGGLAGGLVAFLGARIVSGYEVVATATKLEQRLLQADIVVTGEGSFDRQSLQGKGPGRVLEAAQRHGKDTATFAGRSDIPGVRTLIAMAGDPGQAMDRAAHLLSMAARLWAMDYVAGKGPASP